MLRSSLRSLFAFALLATSSVFAQQPPLSLQCADPREPRDEAALIRKLADGKVVRKSRHVLQVQAGGRTISFTDKPPHDEPFSGTHRWFCDRRDGFILLRTDDDSRSTGTLVNEATGDVTPGGEEVVFSADRRAYFATVQPDGLDGEEWKIYSVKGDLSWAGFSYIPESHDHDMMLATLENPQWQPKGEFTAQATCITARDHIWPVTLKKISNTWDWYPKPGNQCPGEHF